LFLTLECSNIDISYWWKYGGRHIVLHADSMDYRHDFLCNCVFNSLRTIDVGCLRTGRPWFVCVLCIKSQFLTTISDICENILKSSTPGYVDSDFEIKLLNQLYNIIFAFWILIN
jgi:hypothetical protein